MYNGERSALKPSKNIESGMGAVYESQIRTDDLRLDRLSLVQSRLWTNDRRRCLHRLRALLLHSSLARREEAAEEARFLLLRINIQILVIVDLSRCKFARLRVCGLRRRLVGIQSVGHNGHGLSCKQNIDGEYRYDGTNMETRTLWPLRKSGCVVLT